MNVNPKFYNESNQIQTKDGELLLKSIRTQVDDRELNCVVDIGCGTGSLTSLIKDYINCKEIVAFDRSPEMVQFARDNYSAPYIRYEERDVCEDHLKEKLGLPEEGVDIVLSVFCLHWVKGDDRKKAMANIQAMLKPGGKCFLLFFFWSDNLPLQEKWSRREPWGQYFKEVDKTGGAQNGLETGQGTRNGNGVHQGEEAKGEEAQNLRSSAPFDTLQPPSESEALQFWSDLCYEMGLQRVEVSLVKDIIDFGTTQRYQSHLKSICHMVRYIPDHLQEHFLIDYYKYMDEAYTSLKREEFPHLKAPFLYQYLTVTGSKPEP